MRFIDEAKIHVRSGRGGKGCVSFRRERFIPKGGPDGGDGGRGGDVIFVATSQQSSLQDFTYQRQFQAKHGGHGRGKKQHGRDAPNLIMKVPPGTVVRDATSGEVLGDLTEDGQELLVARGGRGGKGNARYATSTRQAPRFSTPPGEGEARWLLLDLKLLADVGLIGFPNAGKSTLLSRLSGARAKTASYPFTTLLPNLGILESQEGDQVVLADVPGLIRGAHKGVGLGFQFLKHVERTRILLHILDLGPTTGRNPLDDYHVVQEELGRYDRRLLERPSLVVLNKSDLPGALERAADVKGPLEAKGVRVMVVSALRGDGVGDVAEVLLEMEQGMSSRVQDSTNGVPPGHRAGYGAL